MRASAVFVLVISFVTSGCLLVDTTNIEFERLQLGMEVGEVQDVVGEPIGGSTIWERSVSPSVQNWAMFKEDHRGWELAMPHEDGVVYKIQATSTREPDEASQKLKGFIEDWGSPTARGKVGGAEFQLVIDILGDASTELVTKEGEIEYFYWGNPIDALRIDYAAFAQYWRYRDYQRTSNARRDILPDWAFSKGALVQHKTYSGEIFVLIKSKY